MKLDNSAAWKDAMASLSANRQVMAAIGGVFFLLPILALALFVPLPEPGPNMTPEQTIKLVTDFYAHAAPYFLLMLVLQAIGLLSILTLCTDLSRPTVGEAIRRGAAGFLPYIASSLITGLGLGIAGNLLGLIAGATGVAALVALVNLLVLVAMVWCNLRTSMSAPVVAVERLRNPIGVLVRSWKLTQGNAGRIALLLFLVFLVFIVILLAVSAVFGSIFVLIFGASQAKVVDAVLLAVIFAGFSIVMANLLAAIHRQLSGKLPDAAATTLD
jgi:hypothetical protein